MLSAHFLSTAQIQQQSAQAMQLYSQRLSGELSLTVHRGAELRDVAAIGKQDPFCRITVGSEALCTKEHDNGQ